MTENNGGLPTNNPFRTRREQRIADSFVKAMSGLPKVMPTISSSTPEELQAAKVQYGNGMTIDDLLRRVVLDGASDLHLSCDSYPRYRVDGDLIDIPDTQMIDDNWLKIQMQLIVPPVIWERFLEDGEADLSYALKDEQRDWGRFRVNVFKQRGTTASVLRTIPTKIKTIAELGVPDSLNNLIKRKKGLILVTGPTGSGKALRLDTEIPTPDGFTTMGELKIGDTVIDSQGNPTTVTGMSDINNSPTLFKVKLSDGQEVYADKDHQWIVGNTNKNTAIDGALAIKLMSEALKYTDYDLITLNELHVFVNDLNSSIVYKKIDQIKASLDFMEIEPEKVLDNGEPVYNASTALYGLGMRIAQKSHNGLDEQKAVMSTLEILAYENFTELTIAVLKDGSVENKIEESIVAIEEVSADSSEYGPVRCISVDSPDHSYLCAEYVVTHNTTTLTAMLDAINETRREHIVTIEDPIEFVHKNKKSLVNQREVGTDTLSFAEALKRVLRQDPDVILIGELRDAETISTALTASETGHLVFGTLHTQSAVKTIDRIIDTFPPAQQGQVRSQLSDTLQAVVAQSLVKKIGGGRVAATEIMLRTDAIANQIREGKVSTINNDISTGRSQGMHTMDQDLIRLVKEGLVDRDEAAPLMLSPASLEGLVAKTNEWDF